MNRFALAGACAALSIGSGAGPWATPANAQAAASAPRAPAPAPMHALEQALETRSGALTLPTGGVGSLVVLPCAGCRPLSLLVGSETRWALGETDVGFAQLQRALAAGPRVPVLVFYRGAGGAVTRLVVRVPAASGVAP